jgi:hypothetical protein
MAWGVWLIEPVGALVNGSFESGWVQEYDPEAYGGLGSVRVTDDPAAAVSFETGKEAIEFWRQIPASRPMRPDGGINRPLTAFSVEIKELPA